MMNSENFSNNLNLQNQIFDMIRNLSEEKLQTLFELLQEWGGENKRKAPRKPCLMPVEYSTSDGFYKDFIQEISSSGAFVGTSTQFLVGQEIVLILSFPDTKRPYKIEGEIVRNSGQGVAIKFKTENKSLIKIIKSNVDKIKKNN